MKRFAVTPVAALLVFALAAFVAGCSKSKSVPSAATVTLCATAAPTSLPTPSGNATAPPLSNLCIVSNPAGLAVQVNASPVGRTPLQVTPPYANSSNAIVIEPNNGNPAFTFLIAQTANGTHNVLYNQSADTSGSIGSISPTAIVRNAKRARVAADFGEGLRRPPVRARGRPALSATRLAVRYRIALLAAAGRHPADIERAEGVARAVDLGFPRNGQVTRIVDVPAGQSLENLAARLRARPEVAAVVRLQMRYLSGSIPVFPNDTLFDDVDQWDMFHIGAPNAWGYFAGASQSIGNPNVQIAVIDTGVDATHPDLAGGKVNYGEKVLNGVVTPGLSAAVDLDGHGTNVAGIAAVDTNNSFGFAGTGYNVRLQVYRVFPDPVPPDYTSAPNYGANTADIAQAIYDAVAHGARVISMSLGGPQSDGVDPIEREAVDYAVGQNVVVVAASGNEATNTLDFPAGYDDVVSAGASALNDSSNPGNPSTATETIASYSNYGPQLSLVAPGGDPSGCQISGTCKVDPLQWINNIYSSTVADPTQRCRDLTDCRVHIAGTSQATPHVAGAAALLLSESASLSPAQIAQLLTSTADDIGDPRQGHGRLDIYRAMAGLLGDTVGLPLPSNSNFVAIAYVPNNSNTPQIIDVSYPKGVPVASDGTFRIADVLPNAPSYKIGVWWDANGNGVVDAGDFFGSSQLCNASASCASASGIVAAPVPSGFTLT